ncbi:MAG: Calx-beta domain-containing protein, partial [Caldimonas sp.]
MNRTSANTASLATRVAALLFPLAAALALAACGGGGDDAPTASATVGASGATVSGPAGAAVAIPAGALAGPTTIAIAQAAAGAPPIPAGVSTVGPIFALTPHGTAFAVPVTVTIPFDPASLPAGATPTLYKTGAGQASWEAVPGASVSGAAMTAQVTGFSFFVVVQGLPPVTRNQPRYDWTFQKVLGNSGPSVLVSNGTQLGGELSKVEDFGPLPNGDSELTTFTQTIPPDGIASGQVFAFDNGVTYGVFAESPSGFLGTAEPIGSNTTLRQRQSFVKNAADATLSFTLTAVVIEGIDYEVKAGRGEVFISGDAFFSVHAFKGANETLFSGLAWAVISGEADTWIPIAGDGFYSKQHLWDMSDFEFTTEARSYDAGNVSCPGTFVQLKLKRPRTYRIDLSSVGVGEEFTVRSDANANTLNRKGGRPVGPDCNGTGMRVFLRDPQSLGGTTLEYTGLTPTNNPLLTEPPLDVLVPPAVCTPGPGPQPGSGTVQFSAAFYAVSEAAGAVPAVMVTRTGGSVGAVTATIATSNGTAVAGTDYQPVLTTVYFGDGDTSPRLVTIPVIDNAFDEPDRNIVLTLSQPGGCAALGPLTSAVLTILD